jgi:hypothetical protein
MRNSKPNKNRIELEWGGGNFSVVLDIRNGGKLYAYSSSKAAEKLHEELGGANYYESVTGLSGAGWIPARPYLRLLSTYRCDASVADMAEGIPNAGVGPVVPIDYRRGIVPLDEFPAVVLESGDELLIGADSLAAAVCGADIPASAVRREFTVICSVGAEPEKVVCEIAVADDYRDQPQRFSRLNTVVKALNFSRLSFAWSESADGSDIGGRNPCNCARWFSRLGLYTFGGNVAYKVVKGICYDRLHLSSSSKTDLAWTDDERMEGLQAITPTNVAFLQVNVYLQGSDEDGYEAVGVFDCSEQSGQPLPDGFYEYETSVETEDAMRAMAGIGISNPDELRNLEGVAAVDAIVRTLQAGAEAKASDDREYAARRKASGQAAAKEKADLLAAIGKHGDAIVTVADSVAAKNCEPGTRQFAGRHFAGRDSVKLSELVPFAGQSDVARVIRVIVKREEDKSAEASSADSA